MKVKNKLLILPVVLFFLFSSCSNSISDFKAYMSFISDVENGLLKNKNIAGLSYQVKYLPIEYLVYNDLHKNTNFENSLSKEQLLKSYKNTVSFVLTIGPDEDEKFDVTMLGVKNYDEYSQRMETLNFSMKEFIQLKVGEKIMTPEIVQMENTYGLEKKRNFLISFKADNNLENKFMKENDVKLVYSDEIFNTGINLFSYKKLDMNNLPNLIF